MNSSTEMQSETIAHVTLFDLTAESILECMPMVDCTFISSM